MAYMSSRRREWHHGRTSHSQLSKQTAFVDPFLLLPLRDQDAIRISQDEGRPLPLTPSSVQLAGSEPRPQPATPPAFLFSSQQRGQVDIPCTQLKGGTTFGDTSPPSSLGWDQGINPATLSEVKTTRATPLFSLHKDQDLAVRSPSAIQVLGTFEEHRERCFFPASGIESCSTPHDGILAPQPSNLATLVPSVQHVASFQRGEPDAHHGSPLLGKDTGEEPRVNQTPNWDVVKDETPVIDATDHFISTLTEELLAYHARANLFYISYIFPGGVVPRDGSVATVLEAVRELIERKRAHPPMPSKQDVKDQIEILGQYAILSHRWEDEELSFTDVENFSDPLVQSKKGFQKLTAFSKTVEEHYGCRYLWMDTVCISEVARNRSIPLMFGWYRRAYVCVVYFTNPGRPEHPGRDGPRDPWFTRGWTLQEFLAAPRINVLTSNSSGDWHLHQSGASKFNACRDNPEIQMTNNIVDSVPSRRAAMLMSRSC
ncbi:hypothetical protein EYR36_010720 [Pleurotus pulmonarius]|nr:hypothetical protein EYR36_010720 [Pleurotus pulmonarius]